MCCDDLIRELATPTGALASSEMADHLATCPACQAASRRSAQFDRIWEITRQPEPSAAKMDALWANALATLEVREAVIPLPPRQGIRRRAMMAAFVMAQAAAILAAAVFLLPRPKDEPILVAVTPKLVAPEPERVAVDVNNDTILVLKIGAARDDGYWVELHDQSHLFDTSRLPAATPHDEFDAWETMASNDGGVVVQ